MKESELLEQIGEERARLNKLYSDYKTGMVELAKLKEELLNRLHENGLRSIKSTNYGVSIVTKPTVEITSESAVKEWLENTPDIESDAYYGLKLTPFKSFATGYLKETGELIDGVVYGVDESVSIRSNK